ncbi:Hsp20/alpha crystallin family protein [Fusibacter paucivorans]|uniref:Hsp20/alpha crystallin family protein n=1 Tax=Fusibacter paucivorans TaxID=76009 RepID=A0ABS5PJY4_9FIRM|nr:Hsp20/alpha crystallin family protein [Fusibacter paucivorans]MBS7525459.1 Hsp20/alpha crystallin family protein [Fusibacter paucivorans]
MTGLVPFNRRRGDVFSNDFYNVLDDFFSDSWPARRSLAADTFKVDVKDEADHYEIVAEVPGVRKDEINVTLDENRLMINIDRDETVEEKENNYLHREIRKCAMKRSVYLGDVDSENISAKLEDGMLKLYVPKQQKIESKRQIEIQ